MSLVESLDEQAGRVRGAVQWSSDHKRFAFLCAACGKGTFAGMVEGEITTHCGCRFEDACGDNHQPEDQPSTSHNGPPPRSSPKAAIAPPAAAGTPPQTPPDAAVSSPAAPPNDEPQSSAPKSSEPVAVSGASAPETRKVAADRVSQRQALPGADSRAHRGTSTTSGADWRGWRRAINDEALHRCPAILHDWLSGGRVNGREFEAGDKGGAAGHSLKVNLKTGQWKDFASDEPGGRDLVSLYARIRNLEWREAQNELAEQFGIARPTPLKLVSDSWEVVTPVPAFAPFDDHGLPILPELSPRCAGGKIVGIWTYCDRDGHVLLYRVRVNLPDGKKDVLPLTFARSHDTGATRWRWKDLPAPRGLYGLELLATKPDAPILVVEGEKTCDAARRLLPDSLVITWPGGSGRVSRNHVDWSPILNRSGRKIIWPDADPPGIKAAAVLADILGKCEIVQPDPA
jgi:hypothetical protein